MRLLSAVLHAITLILLPWQVGPSTPPVTTATIPQATQADSRSELLHWLESHADITPFDLCRWNPHDRRPGYGTFGCDWDVMKFSHSDGAESFRIEVNSYDPDIGSTAIQPDFSIVVIRRVKVDRSPASVKSRMDHRTYDETLGREVEIHDRFVGDKLKLRIVSSVPVSANDSTLPARWDAFLEALAEYLTGQ